MFTYLQEKLRALWDAFYAALLSQASASSSAVPSAPPGPRGVAPGVGNEGASAQQPTLADPVSGPTRMVWSLWQTYGPTVVARGAALLSAASAAAQNPAPTNQSSPLRGEVSGDTASMIERRKRLEAELAALDLVANAAPLNTPPSNNSFPPLAVPENLIQRTRTRTPSGGSSSSSLSRTQVSQPGAASVYLPADAPEDTNGKYERINREDVEGDPLLTGGAGSASPSKDAGGGWFSGWNRNPSGYEKVKND